MKTNNKSIKILSFGEIIWDIYPDMRCIGGAPLNFAAHIVKSGAESYLLSAVGVDELGEKAISKLKAFGIDAEFVSFDDTHPTGQCIVTLDKAGVPSYEILSDVAYDNIALPDVIFENEFHALSFGTLALRGAKNFLTVQTLIEKGHFDKIYCDINLRAPFYSEETVKFCLEKANIIKLSETELEYVVKVILNDLLDYYDAAIRKLSEKYPSLDVILITCGENGSYAYTKKEGRVYHCPASRVEVVSTVGAGDSFGASFLVDYLKGRPIDECLKNSADRSAYVVSHADAVPD